MNKIKNCLLIFLVVFTLVGCGSKEASKNVENKEYSNDEIISNLEYNDYIILYSTDTNLEQIYDKNGNRYHMNNDGETLFSYIDYPFFINDNEDSLYIYITNQVNNYTFTLVSNNSANIYACDYFLRIENNNNADLSYVYSTNYEGVYYTNNNTIYRYTIRDEFDEDSSFEKITKSGEEKCKNFIDDLNKELGNIGVSLEQIVNLKEYLIDKYFNRLVEDTSYSYMNYKNYDGNIDEVVNMLEGKGCTVSITNNDDSIIFEYTDSPSEYKLSITRDSDNTISLLMDTLDSDFYDNVYAVSRDGGKKWEYYQRIDGEDKFLMELPFNKSPLLDYSEDGMLTADIMLVDGCKNSLFNYLDYYTIFNVVDLIKNY